MNDLTEFFSANEERCERQEERCEKHDDCCERHSGMEQHNHEVLGSTMVAECCKDCHNHRFATVSGEAMRRGSSHVHKIKFKTDTYEGHYHEFEGTSGPAVIIPGSGRHIHYVKAYTRDAEGHKHEFRVATLIENPIGDK